MITNQDIVSSLDALRIEKHKSIQFITRGIISNRNYTRLLNNESSITMDVLEQLLERINVPIDEFILYLDSKNEIANYNEEYLVNLVLYENYDKALTKFKDLLEIKNYQTSYGFKAVPAALGYLDYYQKKIGLEALRELLKGLINLKEIERTNIIHDYDIYVLYMYVKVATPEERERVCQFFIKNMYSSIRLIARNYNVAYAVSFAVVLYCITNKEQVTRQDDNFLLEIVEKILDFNAKTKLTPYDIIIFEILYKYIKTYNFNAKYVTYYYIASILATSNNDFLRGRTFEVTEEDVENYYSLLNDDKFVNSLMYKKMIVGGIK